MYARTSAALLLASLAACAASRPGVVSLSIEAIPTGQQEWRQINRSHVWHSGDRYVLRVLTSRAAYVYAVRLAPSGSAKHLYPREGAPQTPVLPGKALQIPTDEPWFVLDDDVGDDRLRVIASLQPLSRAQVDEEARRPPPVRVREPPPIRTGKDRSSEIARAWIERPGKETGGVGTVRVSFRHE